MVKCEICGEEFRNPQGLSGHKRWKHQLVSTQNSPAQSVAEQQSSKLEGSRSKMELLEGRLDILEEQQEEQTEQVEDLTEYHRQSSEQLNEYSQQQNQHAQQLNELTEQLKKQTDQLELSKVTNNKLSKNAEDQEKMMELLREGLTGTRERQLDTMRRFAEFMADKYTPSQDEAKEARKQVVDLKEALGQIQKGVQSELAQIDTRVVATEQNIPHIEKELKRLETLACRIPTGKIVCHPEYESDSHNYKEYRTPEGLARPYRASWGLNSESWIDLDAPLD